MNNTEFLIKNGWKPKNVITSNPTALTTSESWEPTLNDLFSEELIWDQFFNLGRSNKFINDEKIFRFRASVRNRCMNGVLVTNGETIMETMSRLWVNFWKTKGPSNGELYFERKPTIEGDRILKNMTEISNKAFLSDKVDKINGK